MRWLEHHRPQINLFEVTEKVGLRLFGNNDL